MLRTRISVTAIVTVFTLVGSVIADIPINERTSQDQKDCDGARLGQYGYVLVWSSYLHDGNSGAIVARQIDKQGLPLGSEYQINQTTTGNQSAPAVATDIFGNTLIAWQSPSDQDDTDIWARVFDPNGQALTDEFLVNQNTTGDQSLPRTRARNDGSYIVVWESEGLPGYSNKAICMRIVDVNGQTWGDEIVASDTPDYVCRNANVAANSAGTFCIAWLEDRTSDAIRMRRFDTEGNPIDASTKVNTETFKSITWPDCDMTPDGQLIITWDGDPKKASEDDIHARLYDPNGEALGEQFTVNTHTPGPQRNPAVAIAPTGDFLIAWDSDDPNSGNNIKARHFDNQGQPLTEEFTINTHLADDQTEPAVVLSEDGKHLIAWQSKAQDTSGWGIFASVSQANDPNDLEAP